MASLVDTLLALALGMAFVLGIWLVLILGSLLLWRTVNRAVSRWIIPDIAEAVPGAERVDPSRSG